MLSQTKARVIAPVKLNVRFWVFCNISLNFYQNLAYRTYICTDTNIIGHNTFQFIRVNVNVFGYFSNYYIIEIVV